MLAISWKQFLTRFIIALFFFVPGTPSIGNPSTTFQVSFIRLISNPDDFDGLTVNFAAYVIRHNNVYYAFPTKEHVRMRDFPSSIAIGLAAGYVVVPPGRVDTAIPSSPDINERYLRIEGVFDKDGFALADYSMRGTEILATNSAPLDSRLPE